MTNVDPLNVVIVLGLCTCTLAAVAASKICALRKFLHYGKTRSTAKPVPGLLNALADITVPRSWFAHFYVELVTLVLLRALIVHEYDLRGLLLLVQGTRRIYEQLSIMRPSSTSRMHLSHYLVGLFFYACQALCKTTSCERSSKLVIAVFGISSIYQHACHKSLAATRKYDFPRFPLRGSFLGTSLLTACPHYGAEILIYLCLTCLVNPVATNGGIYVCISSFLWVAVSLGISGNQSREFYLRSYDTDDKGSAQTTQAPHMWAVMPFVF